MANCQSCGNELKNGGKFCGICGAPVVEKAEPVNKNVSSVEAAPIIPNGSVTGELPADSMGLTGFICGILGLTICCGITSIPALICSIISMKNVKKGKVRANTSWMGIVGLVLGIIGTLCLVVIALYFVLVFSVVLTSGI